MSKPEFIEVGRAEDMPGLLELLRANDASFAGPFRRQRPQRPLFPGRGRGKLKCGVPGSEGSAEAAVEEPREQEVVAGARGSQARPPVHMPGVLVPDYGPPTQISPNIRLQTQRGYRAAIIQLGPGLTLVAEVPSSACHPQFGLDPVLTPMIINAAASALTNPQVQQGLVQTGQSIARAGQGVVQSVQQAFRPQPPVPAQRLPPPPPTWGPPMPWPPQPAQGPLVMVGYQPPPPYFQGAPVYELPPVQQPVMQNPYGWSPTPNFGCEGCGGRCNGRFQGEYPCNHY